MARQEISFSFMHGDRGVRTFSRSALLVPAVAFLFLAYGGFASGDPQQRPFPTGLFFEWAGRSVVEIVEQPDGALQFYDRVKELNKVKWALPPKQTYTVDKPAGNLLLISKRDEVRYVDYTALLYRPNSLGGFDLLGYAVMRDSLGDESQRQIKERGDYAKTLDRWRKGKPPSPSVFQQALCPVPDRELVEIVAKSHSDPRGALAKLDTLIARRPDCLLYQALALDLEILQEDAGQVRVRLNRYEPGFRRGGQPMFAEAADYYHDWLDGMEKNREGRNLFSKFRDARGRTAQEKKMPLELSVAVRLFGQARYDDFYFVPTIPFLLSGTYRGTDSTDLQIKVKCFRVSGDFCLLQGNTEGALGWLFPVHRVGTILSGRSNTLYSALVGTALRSRADRSLDTAYLSGMRSVEELQRDWPWLDEAYRADLAVSRSPKNNELTRLKDISELYEANQREFETRGLVAHARMALLHTAVAARFQWMIHKRFPANDAEFGPLLPGGPDPDPFADFKQPLRISSETTTRTFCIYSLGPDRTDQHAKVEYDPTNGTISAGDLFIDVPRKRKYPFPPPGQLATTRDAILAQFPNGLPPDPFADLRPSSYAITDTQPAWILSWGPDVDQKRHAVDFTNVTLMDLSKYTPEQRKVLKPFASYRRITPVEAIPPAGNGVSTAPGGYIRYPNLVPGVVYDPTNGTLSDGDLFFSTGRGAGPYGKGPRR